MTARPLVIGVGNEFRRDDGVGPAVVARLRGEAVDADLTLADGEPTRLVDAWDGRDLVVVVDAVRTGAAPGTVVVLDALTADLPTGPTASTHAAGIGQAVEWGRALDRLPGALWLVGVEGADFGEGPGLSAAVGAAVTDAATHVGCLLDAAAPH